MTPATTSNEQKETSGNQMPSITKDGEYSWEEVGAICGILSALFC